LISKTRKEGIQPNVGTYNILIDKSPDYRKTDELMAEMKREGIQPSINAFCILFSKASPVINPEEIIRMYEEGKYTSEEPIQAAIANYRKHKMIEQALYLSKRFPHLKAAQKVLQQVGE
jgi:hypothetical protein